MPAIAATSRDVQVDVVLAAYNGACFLEQQIASILNQTHSKLRLIVRDDGSSDETADILYDIAARHPQTVKILDAKEGHLGSCGSFGRLLQVAEADYVLLSDQDDFWLPDKIKDTLDRVREMELAFGSDYPILVHTDLAVADASLQPMSNSFWAYAGLDPVNGGNLNRLLLQNVVTGCTVMANRALLQKAMPIPPQAIMHDWWLALAAAGLGKLVYLPKATVLYRQHERNRVGAHALNARYAIRRGLTYFKSGGMAEQLRDTQRQAKAFLDRFGHSLPMELSHTVQAYAELHNQGFVSRRLTLIRHGLYKHGWLRNLGLFVGV